MIKDILIVSNSKEFTEDVKEKLNYIVELITSSGKNVHIFKEDIQLYSLLRQDERVYSINALLSGADVLLFNRMHEGLCSSNDKIKTITLDLEDVKKRCLSRFPTPNRESTYDDVEYNTRRESVMNSRMRFAISNISNNYQFIILLKDSKEFNLLNSINPSYGDGKFYYIYDCSKNKSDFIVGGCSLPEDNFEKCLRGV